MTRVAKLNKSSKKIIRQRERQNLPPTEDKPFPILASTMSAPVGTDQLIYRRSEHFATKRISSEIIRVLINFYLMGSSMPVYYGKTGSEMLELTSTDRQETSEILRLIKAGTMHPSDLEGMRINRFEAAIHIAAELLLLAGVAEKANMSELAVQLLELHARAIQTADASFWGSKGR